MSEQLITWHHAPAHFFAPGTTYIVTASTLAKQRIFTGDDRLRLLCDALFNVLDTYGWLLQAWAIFANHYHFVAQSPDDAGSLRPALQRLHSETARAANAVDGTRGRQVWFQYWDTCLTFEKSYYPRLNYVHNNAVKHGLVSVADLYPYCSAAWFHAQAEPSFLKKVESYRYDRIRIRDDF